MHATSLNSLCYDIIDYLKYSTTTLCYKTNYSVFSVAVIILILGKHCNCLSSGLLKLWPWSNDYNV